MKQEWVGYKSQKDTVATEILSVAWSSLMPAEAHLQRNCGISALSTVDGSVRFLLYKCFVMRLGVSVSHFSQCPQEVAADTAEEEDVGAPDGSSSSSSGGPAIGTAPVPFEDAVRNILDEHNIDAHARCRKNVHCGLSQSQDLDRRRS